MKLVCGTKWAKISVQRVGVEGVWCPGKMLQRSKRPTRLRARHRCRNRVNRVLYDVTDGASQYYIGPRTTISFESSAAIFIIWRPARVSNVGRLREEYVCYCNRTTSQDVTAGEGVLYFDEAHTIRRRRT